MDRLVSVLLLVAIAGPSLAAEPPRRDCGDNELWQAVAGAVCVTGSTIELDEPDLARALKIANRMKVKYIEYGERDRELIVPLTACTGRFFDYWQPFMVLAVQRPKDIKPPLLRFYLISDGQLTAAVLGKAGDKTFTRFDPNEKLLQGYLKGERTFWLRYFKLMEVDGRVKGCL